MSCGRSSNGPCREQKHRNYDWFPSTSKDHYGTINTHTDGSIWTPLRTRSVNAKISAFCWKRR